MPRPPDVPDTRTHGVIPPTRLGWLVAAGLGGLATLAEAQEAEVEDQLIRRQLDEVLAQPEFSRLRVEPPSSVETPHWLKQFFDWFIDLFPSWKFDPNTSGLVGFLKLLPSIVGVFLAAGIILLIIRLINNWRSRQIDAERKLSSLEVSVGATPPGEFPADEYLRRAELAAANGIFSEAIAQLLLGTLSATERQGLIRFRKGLTYRDYRRALRKVQPAQEAFQTLCGIYLPVGFGRRPADRHQFEESLRHYRQVVQSVGIPAAVGPVSATNAPDTPPAAPAAT
ncbi:MAG: DUF4129 domain-containing protein [Planctomycetaceae bacterium]